MGEPLNTREVEDRRRARLRDELVDAGLPVPSGPTGELLVDELAYARWAGVHEHRRFGYGSVLNPRDAANLGEPLARIDRSDGGVRLSELRTFADGRRIFLVRDLDREPQLVTIQAPDELALVRLHRATGGTVVRRIDSGMQLVAPDGTVADYTGRWTLRPSLSTVLQAVGDRVRLRDQDVLSQILDLCLHVLSPRHVGAIIVWRLEASAHDMLTRPPAPAPLDLSVATERHLDAIAKRVALMDGACVVERDGAITGFGAFLGWSTEAREQIEYETGLRHSAARWYSYDVPGELVFVVSEDGPVSLYAGGSVLLSAASGSSGAEQTTLA